ncbi:spore protease YyaC (plasmid) [Pontibacillus sp. ALD_SL1]|nr:spore protease YyaC [Pontibacillus sp. ALD_SL1]
MKEPNARISITKAIGDRLPSDGEIVIVCIGTDRCTGDSLGPLVGTFLEKENLKRTTVYGTLHTPVHATNLEETVYRLKTEHKDAFIIGIDACLGKVSSIGSVVVDSSPVKPGAAVAKELPEIGDMSIGGVVNAGGYMEYFILQNTRLSMVYDMAKLISRSLKLALNQEKNSIA